MRKLSSLEKEIVEKLVNSPALNEQGLILCSKFLEDNYIGKGYEMSLMVRCIDKKVIMAIPKKDIDFDEFQREKVIFIITFFNLIKDLQDERKIYLIGDNDKEGLLGPEYTIKVQFAPDLNSIICETFFKLIAVSQELKEYVKNGFKSDEEIRHQQSLTISKIGIFIAILIGLLSIFLSLYIDHSSEKTVVIDSSQYDTLRKDIDKLILSQEKLNGSLIECFDTLKYVNSEKKYSH